MYKLIFSDADGTLLDSNGQVSEANVKAISKAEEKGIGFVLCSGRQLGACSGIIRSLGLEDKENVYTISSNGAVVSENKGNKVLHTFAISLEDTAKVYDLVRDQDLKILIMTDKDVYYFYGNGLKAGDIKKFSQMDRNLIEDLSLLKDQLISKLVINSDRHEDLVAFLEKLEGLRDDLTMSFSDELVLEITAKGVDKSSGMKWLVEYLGIELKEVIAVGDQLNDLPMIKAAGLGTCVSNAKEDVKAGSDLVLDASNDEDAIAKLINRIL